MARRRVETLTETIDPTPHGIQISSHMPGKISALDLVDGSLEGVLDPIEILRQIRKRVSVSLDLALKMLGRSFQIVDGSDRTASGAVVANVAGVARMTRLANFTIEVTRRLFEFGRQPLEAEVIALVSVISLSREGWETPGQRE